MKIIYGKFNLDSFDLFWKFTADTIVSLWVTKNQINLLICALDYNQLVRHT